MSLLQRKDILDIDNKRKDIQQEQSRREWVDEKKIIHDKFDEVKTKL